MTAPAPEISARDELVRHAATALRSPTDRGVTLVGPAGIGKTRLARELASSVEAELAVVWITGSAATSDVPLGAFAPYLPSSSDALGLPSILSLREKLTELAAGRRLMLAIDDGHDLDEASAALVHQLALTSDAQLLVTQRAGAPAPDSITRLWRDDILRRVDVQPLTKAEVAALVTSMLGGPVEPASADAVWARSGGNPLFARELVLAGRDAHEWEHAATGWRWTSTTKAAPRLRDLLADRFESLDEAQRDTLVYLAFGEPMGLGELRAVASDAVIDSLERLELITADVDGKRLHIRFAHPVHAEVVRRSVTPLRARVVRAALVDGLLATGARRREDEMRIAALAVEAGVELDTGLVCRAARIALYGHDRELGTRLAEIAFERDPNFETGHVLADALYEDGRFEAIRAHWAAWQPHVRTDAERAVLALNQANSWFNLAGDEQHAFGVLDDTIASLTDREQRDELTALDATLNMLAGRITTALTLAEPLLTDDTGGRAFVVAALAVTRALRAAGRPSDGLAVHARAAARIDDMHHAEWVVSAAAFDAGRASLLIASGALREGLAAADAVLVAANRSGDTTAEGLGHLARADALAMLGRYVDADQAARASEAAFARSNNRGLRRRAVGQRAFAAAMDGEATALVRALDDLAPLMSHPATVFGDVDAVAAARLLTIEGRLADADRLLADTAMRMNGRGETGGAIRCLYERVRIGATDDDLVQQLTDLCASTSEALHAAIATHAAALATDDAEATASAAEAFADVGALGWAITAGEQATRLAAAHGDEQSAGRWAIQAETWRRGLQSAVVRGDEPRDTIAPAVASRHSPDAIDAPHAPLVDPLVPLTRREGEIATLAAQGLSSRSISERLYLSARTVENHLARVYMKLGIRSRAELAHALAAA